jgi:hypothetical protein
VCQKQIETAIERVKFISKQINTMNLEKIQMVFEIIESITSFQAPKTKKKKKKKKKNRSNTQMSDAQAAMIQDEVRKRKKHLKYFQFNH